MSALIWKESELQLHVFYTTKEGPFKCTNNVLKDAKIDIGPYFYKWQEVQTILRDSSNNCYYKVKFSVYVLFYIVRTHKNQMGHRTWKNDLFYHLRMTFKAQAFADFTVNAQITRKVNLLGVPIGSLKKVIRIYVKSKRRQVGHRIKRGPRLV